MVNIADREQSVEHIGSRDRARTGRRSVAVLAACGILMALQQTMILPLLPSLPTLLNTSASNASWLVTATLVSGAVVTPLIGRLADMYGKRRRLGLVLPTASITSVPCYSPVPSLRCWYRCPRAVNGAGPAAKR
ncbi:MAG: MFS transporter [Nocardia sp.]|nr:MFS transporter [Nocardia sp.]